MKGIYYFGTKTTSTTNMTVHEIAWELLMMLRTFNCLFDQHPQHRIEQVIKIKTCTTSGANLHSHILLYIENSMRLAANILQRLAKGKTNFHHVLVLNTCGFARLPRTKYVALHATGSSLLPGTHSNMNVSPSCRNMTKSIS